MNRKKVLVTGGAGFIGSHLVKRLVSQGADVMVTVKYNSLNDNIRLSPVWDKITLAEADLRNIDSLRELKKKKFDIVYHLAAYNHVGDSFLHVNESLMSNAVATANLLECGPEYGRFVYISSSESYGLQKKVPFTESSTPFPISPYAIGKYAGELYAQMKRHQTKGPIIFLRPFNTFGPYQSEKAIIPELIIKSLLGRQIETTEGKQTREFNFVDNIIDGFIAAGEVETIFDGVINIGSQDPIAIRDLVKKIHTLSDSKSELHIGKLQNRPTEIWEMSADNRRAKNILKWEPRISFEEGLLITIDWFRKYVGLFYNKESQLNQL